MKLYYNDKNYARTSDRELPSLIDIQKKSFDDFFYGGRLKELFDEINPIQSFNGNLSLYFPGNHADSEEFEFQEPPADHRPYTLLNESQKPKKGLQMYMQAPKYDEEECIERDVSYAAPMYVQVAMVNHEQGDEIIRQNIFMGEFPLMTEKGTFIINGTERVVVSQLIRSPGVYFDIEEDRATGRQLSNAKLIPDRGAWMEFETRKTDYITLKFNRKRTIPVTILLRALASVEDGLPKSASPIKTGEDEEILALFADVDTNETHKYIESCIKNEPDWEVKKNQSLSDVALIEFYKRMRPGDPPTLDNAKEYLQGQLFDKRRYDLERVGRYKLNQRLGLEGVIGPKHRTISKADLVKLVEQMILINNGARVKDDIDHLGNRRVKTVGELIGNKLRIGLRRMERVVRERMSIREAEQLTPVSLVNIRPIVAAVREFFGSSQLSQFMEQTNPLSELTHKRTLSALGPGGLRRERAGFDVRDVHHSHYGRICPIETPEGPNIGLIGRLASYARVNELGFIETPYRRVVNAMDVGDPELIGRVLRDDVEVALRVEAGEVIDEVLLERLRLFGDEVDELPVLAKNDEVFTLLARIADLGSDESLEETQQGFEAFAAKAAGEYARLDSEVFELRRTEVERVINAHDLPGRTLSDDVETTILVRPDKAITAELIEDFLRFGINTVEIRKRREVEKEALFEVDDSLLGATLTQDVVVSTADTELIALIEKAEQELENPSLEKTRNSFNELLDEMNRDFRRDLDKWREQLDNKKIATSADAAKAFVNNAPQIMQRVRTHVNEFCDAREAANEALRAVLAHPTMPEKSSKFVKTLQSQEKIIDELKSATDEFGTNLEQFAGAVSDRLPGSGIAKSKARSFRKVYKPLVNFSQGRSAAQTFDEDVRDGLRRLKRLAESSESETAFNSGTLIDETVFARLQDLGVGEVKASKRVVESTAEPATVDSSLVGEILASEIKEKGIILEKGAVLDADAIDLLKRYGITEVKFAPRADDPVFKRFLDVYDQRMEEIAQAYDDYGNARAELRSLVVQLRQQAELPAALAEAADRFLAKVERHGEERDELEKGLRNLNKAVSEIVALDGQSIPKNLRDRVQRHGTRLQNYPKRLQVATSNQASAGQALETLIKAEGVTEDVIQNRPISQELLGEKIGKTIKIESLLLEEGAELDAGAIDLLMRHGVAEAPVKPFATREIEYLSADKEDKFIIAQANAERDEREQFISNRVSARHDLQFVSVPPRRVEYMDIAPRQIVGISAALIPFLSHDAANRALMGSNMQRQAVPLITPDVSVVSTGMEQQAASDSGQVLVSDVEAEVISAQGHRVIVRTKDGEERAFQLRKYERSNQSTCIDQRPVVRKGDWIKPGDVIADSSSTYDGHLALGHDVLTCFLSWDGGNYEDALLVSEDLLRNDKFTSIHIEKHEIEARDTKLGAEEITYDIPNVGEEALKDLDEHGIVRIGAEVGPNDILVGKITPKGEKELSPEEKLLRAIFGEQAREVKDSSLRLPHGDRGKVIDVKVFTRDEHPDLPAGVEKMVRVSVAQRRKLTVGDKMAGRHGNKGVISKIVSVADMPYIDGGVPVEIILNPLGVPSRMNIGQILELHLGWAADRMGFRAITPVFDGVKEQEIQAELGRAWMIDWAWGRTKERAWENQARLAASAGIAADEFTDDLHLYQSYLVDCVGGSLNDEIIELVQDLEDRPEEIVRTRVSHHLKRVAASVILREFGYDPDEIMVYDNSELSAELRDERDLKALEASIRLWIQETAPESVDLAEDLSARELFEIADRVMFETGSPVPHYGKQTLYDGRTGEPFDRHVAVGYVHMLKLAHLVEDKAHARSTGPYSLVTQQPLGGKAQFGGQRFGEMEVWALEAYGAAHILQEMLTVKSDDVQGRVKTYESIVKGDPIEEPGIPTSFRVLVKELQSLGLSVEAITGAGDVIRFGKYDEQARKPQPETGLLGLGTG